MWATHRTLIFAAWHTLPIVRRSRFGFSDEVWLYSLGTGVWRSLVARFVRDEEAVGSNPATPTVNRRDRLVPAILYVYSQTDCQHGCKGGNEAGAGGVATMQHAPTAVPEDGGRAPLRHAGSCGTRGRRQGAPSTCGQLRYPRAAAGPGRASSRRAELKARGADGERAGHRPRVQRAAGEASHRPRVQRAAGEASHQHCAVTIKNGDPTHQQHGRQGPHERSSHVHNAEACITNLFHVINFQCIHSHDI